MNYNLSSFWGVFSVYVVFAKLGIWFFIDLDLFYAFANCDSCNWNLKFDDLELKIKMKVDEIDEAFEFARKLALENGEIVKEGWARSLPNLQSLFCQLD